MTSPNSGWPIGGLRAEESLYSHVTRRKRELAGDLVAITTVYLDTNFWIWLERSARGKALEPSHTALLAELRRGVAGGHLRCPTTDGTILELVLRHPPDRQHEPLALIDELSQSTSLLPQRERIELEVDRLLASPNGSDPRLVWVRSSYLFGETHPIPNPEFFDERAQLEIQKRFFEHLWWTPVSSFMMTTGGLQYDERTDLEALASTLDQANRLHSTDGGSFREFLDIERRGMGETLSELAEPVAKRLRPEETYEARLWSVFFSKALGKPAGQRKLPTANILSSLHAIRRSDTSRRVKPNDHHDFDHATAALAYCDAFFCENGLADSIRSAGLATADCFVTSKVEDALTFIANLPRSCP